MASTRIQLLTGERLVVAGDVGAVAKGLEDAARSSAGTLAWLQDATRDELLGVNPAYVVTVRAAED